MLLSYINYLQVTEHCMKTIADQIDPQTPSLIGSTRKTRKQRAPRKGTALEFS